MGDLTAGLLEIWLGASIVSAFCNLALALGREGVRGGGHFSWELRHRGGVNHQAGTKAKTARRKLGLWPRLRALGSIQLEGAVPAGPDVESHRVAGDCLTAGERDKEQSDMTIQRVKYCHLRKHWGLGQPGKEPKQGNTGKETLGGSREVSWRRGSLCAETPKLSRSCPG